MGLWKKNTKEFSVSVIDRGVKGFQIQLPRPVFEYLGRPKQITFKIERKKVILT
ncbi:MAG: hypothetical protein HMLIMOIP_001814 [Candidatus Nitrosomirales archaeon]|jgi:hypothetical protein